MSLFGKLQSGLLGEVESAALPALISTALAKTSLGSLQGLLAQLQQNGLGQQVQSWLGSGPNQPVTSEQLRAALSNEHVRALAQHFGVDTDQVLKLLAEHLPKAVDQASPTGTLKPGV